MEKEYQKEKSIELYQKPREKEVLYGKISLLDQRKVVAMCSLCGGGSDCSCGSCGICNCGSCESCDLVDIIEKEWV